MTHQPHTRLSGKEFSPLVLRRVSMPFLHFVCIISDDNLDTLDDVIQNFWAEAPPIGTIQQMRNACGALQEDIVSEFPHTEGCAVVFSADKMLVVSLAGDHMNHLGCRLELFSLLQLSNLL